VNFKNKVFFFYFNLFFLLNIIFGILGGSKCLSTNLGWVGCTNRAVIEYMKVHCTAYMFTNAVNPV
jgi:hypothetical protein